MITIDTYSADTKNPLLQQVEDNLQKFIENIRCVYETFLYSEATLRQQHDDANKKYNDFIKSFTSIREDCKKIIKIQIKDLREYKKLKRRLERADKAFSLIPPSYLVSLVSAYDSFVAGLIRCVYNVSPEKLQESEKTFIYRDLMNLQTIGEVKNVIVDKCIDTQLRESHIKQIEWFTKAFGLKTLKNFKDWGTFVELTERRNLFVHSNGIISAQYISECTNNDALEKGLIEGAQLSVDEKYFKTAYKTIYEVGVMLSQMLMRTLCAPKDVTLSEDIDQLLISNVFELIVQENYDVAIKISEFSLDSHFKHSARDKKFILLNLAQSYKWNGENDKCLDILRKEDWSADSYDLKIPMYVLQENYDEAFKLMRALGNSNDTLTCENYNDWPIFKEFRKQPQYSIAIAEIFGIDFMESKPVILEDSNAKTVVDSTTSKEDVLSHAKDVQITTNNE